MSSFAVNVEMVPLVGGVSKRDPWKSLKKNSLFFLIGPPKVPPNSFHRRFAGAPLTVGSG